MGNYRSQFKVKTLDEHLRLIYNAPGEDDQALKPFEFEALCEWDRAKKRQHSSLQLKLLSGSHEKFSGGR